MDNMQTLLERQQVERDKLEKEIHIAAQLPLEPQSIHAFKHETRITYGQVDQYGITRDMPLTQALAVVRRFQHCIDSCTIRDAGCVSIKPEALQDAVYVCGKLRGYSVISLTLEGGSGYGPNRLLEFYACGIDNDYLRVKVMVMVPRLHLIETTQRDLRNRRIGPKRWEPVNWPEGAYQIKWASGSEESYRFSWHWSDLKQFMDWAEKEEKAHD